MSRRSFRKDEGGQAVVLIAIVFLGLLMAVGLAIDAGQLYVARRTMQEAADSAAYAGAVVKYQGGTTLQMRAAAVNDATLNGYTCQLVACGAVGDTPNGISVVVNVPPASGIFSGDLRYVQVIISAPVRTALVPAQSTLTQVTVRGTAGAEPLNNGYAIMALDRGNTPSSFYAGPNADIHLTGGGILVNSTSATAATSSQCTPSRFTIGLPAGTDVAGTGSGCFPTTGTGLRNSQPQQADPMSGFQKPSTTGMTTYGSLPGGSPMTINPGIYNVVVGGAGGTTIYLNPGIYILKNGINGAGNADLISNSGGVFIFNTHTNYPGNFRPGIDTCGSINLTGNATSNLQAMTTSYTNTLPAGNQEATYVNFLVYQDPNCTNNMMISGNGTFAGTGTIYVPTGGFVFDGNNATLTGSQLIAKTVNIQNGNITIDFNAGNTAQPILPRLSE